MTLYVIDTDHLSLYERGNLVVQRRILAARQADTDDLAITVVTVEEQFAGRLAQVRKATTPQNLISAYAYLKMTLLLFSDLEVLDYDAKADACFREFRQPGLRIGTQDLRIAAITLANSGILVTRNRRDFEKVPKLVLQDWSIG
jgi:tRNA(fMet)-specific endonuclease VapC